MSEAGIIPTKILDLQFGGGLPPDQAEQVLSKTLSSSKALYFNFFQLAFVQIEYWEVF